MIEIKPKNPTVIFPWSFPMLEDHLNLLKIVFQTSHF